MIRVSLILTFREIPIRLLRQADWQVDFASRFRTPEYIGVLEGRGVVSAARHKLRKLDHFRKLHLHIGDNQGLELGLDKGRASTFFPFY